MSFQLKKFNTFIAATATAVIAATAVAPVASAATFKDVPDNALYKDATDFLYTKGVKGLTDGTFGVNKNITRADAAVMLANVLELDINAAPSAGFTDVNARVEKHVNALYEAEITKGAGNNKFNSNANITRGELAIWLQRAFELKAKEVKTPFADIDPKGIYADAVAALVEHKVTLGKSATLFGTTSPATRGEYALFLYRAFMIDEQPTLEAAIADAEKAIAGIPSIEDFSEEYFSVIEEVYLKLVKVEELGGNIADIKNIGVYNDLLSSIFIEDEWPEVKDLTVDLDSGEVTLKFTNADVFKEYSVSVWAFVEENEAEGTIAKALTGTNSDELVITFDPKDLTETSTINVDVEFFDEEIEIGTVFMYVISAESGVWNIRDFEEEQ